MLSVSCLLIGNIIGFRRRGGFLRCSRIDIQIARTAHGHDSIHAAGLYMQLRRFDLEHAGAGSRFDCVDAVLQICRCYGNRVFIDNIFRFHGLAFAGDFVRRSGGFLCGGLSRSFGFCFRYSLGFCLRSRFGGGFRFGRGSCLCSGRFRRRSGISGTGRHHET